MRGEATLGELFDHAVDVDIEEQEDATLHAQPSAVGGIAVGGIAARGPAVGGIAAAGVAVEGLAGAEAATGGPTGAAVAGATHAAATVSMQAFDGMLAYYEGDTRFQATCGNPLHGKMCHHQKAYQRERICVVVPHALCMHG